MMLLEHDAKTLLASFGVPIPAGILVERAGDAVALAHDLSGPLIVKAQVPVGGRGKAGGIVRNEDRDQLASQVAALLAMTIKGHPVRGCRIEQAVSGRECYVSLSIDPAAAGVRILVSREGGVEIESVAAAALGSATCALDRAAITQAAQALIAGWPDAERRAVGAAVAALAEALIGIEALLVEINPLFVRDDGTWTAGDAKIVADDSVVARQPVLERLLTDRAVAYPDAVLKFRDGFDYICIDPGGEVGLVTTGAGLSMQIIDELVTQGYRPYNFVDIRSGQFRGDPKRLIQVMRDISTGTAVRVVLVNIFAGITHLGEFARLLRTALAAVPELRVPIVARLVGNGFEEARTELATSSVELVTELDEALLRVVGHLGTKPHAPS